MDEKLSVRTICQLTGINEHTLRAWERRYGIVVPRRQENGRRTYSLEDLEKLKLIVLLLRKGFLIGHIAGQSLQDLKQLVGESAQNGGLSEPPVAIPVRVVELKQAMETAVREYDLNRMNTLLHQAELEYPIREFLFDFVLPLLGQVGDFVAKGQFTYAQEHGFSAVVKYHLMQLYFTLMENQGNRNGVRAVKTFAVATMINNFHEFGAMVASLLCAYHGYQAFYLGPNMPVEALASAAQALKANALIISLPLVRGEEAAISAYIAELVQRMPPLCDIWLGGGASPGAAIGESQRFRHFATLQEIDRLLAAMR